MSLRLRILFWLLPLFAGAFSAFAQDTSEQESKRAALEKEIAQLEQQTGREIEALQERMDREKEEELESLRRQTQQELEGLKHKYDTEHDKISDEILKSIIRM